MSETEKIFKHHPDNMRVHPESLTTTIKLAGGNKHESSHTHVSADLFLSRIVQSLFWMVGYDGVLSNNPKFSKSDSQGHPRSSQVGEL
jgi:hypothetical protein